ncbi:MAG TPA: MCE family protein [Stackebrandtia sp.]|jgi:phospholipid/cholesterol/gamma-HCH transport system substrate-binding protein|uniref:MCE family protein n=1 Tax=Stackebrandtia sp. TaxID=2023065 RepID=UPI002D74DA99|nr:MCE family protein [Stackebrandtia sp.]HZE37638.1 MCE family protein [Stackebrandtia sp.]
MRRSRWLQIIALTSLVGLSGCASAPLPGGEGGDGYEVTIEFVDVTDLVPYSTVKVNDVTVGQVESVDVTKHWTARVKVRVRDDVDLPHNARAKLRQTSLLGEKFVDLGPPEKAAPSGKLGDGDSIPLSHTDKGAEVEEVLGALALVLQGGGLDQLRTINTELSDMMNGREDKIRDSLSEVEKFVKNLDDQKDDIVKALEALDKISGDLADERKTIADALDAIAPGVTTLAKQKDMITGAITALGDLGDTGSDVIDKSGDNTVALLEELKPVLGNLVKAGDTFPQELEQFGSYPFPHNVTNDISNGYVNLHITLDAQLGDILGNVLGDKPVADAEDSGADSGNGSDGIDPVTGGLGDLLGVGLGGDDQKKED